MTAVIGQKSMARRLEKQLQLCCSWALVPVKADADGRLEPGGVGGSGSGSDDEDGNNVDDR